MFQLSNVGTLPTSPQADQFSQGVEHWPQSEENNIKEGVKTKIDDWSDSWPEAADPGEPSTSNGFSDQVAYPVQSSTPQATGVPSTQTSLPFWKFARICVFYRRFDSQ